MKIKKNNFIKIGTCLRMYRKYTQTHTVFFLFFLSKYYQSFIILKKHIIILCIKISFKITLCRYLKIKIKEKAEKGSPKVLFYFEIITRRMREGGQKLLKRKREVDRDVGIEICTQLMGALKTYIHYWKGFISFPFIYV